MLKLKRILWVSLSLSLASCGTTPVEPAKKICVRPKLDAIRLVHPIEGEGVFLTVKELSKQLKYIDCLEG